MSEYEVNVKINVDSTEVDETIEKFKQLAEAIEVVNGLMKELENANTANVKAEIAMDSEFAAHKLRHSQLEKEFEKMDARIKGRLNRSRY